MPSKTHRTRLMFRSLSFDCLVGTLRCKADQTQIMSVSTQEMMRSHVPRKLGAEYHVTSAAEADEKTPRTKDRSIHESNMTEADDVRL